METSTKTANGTKATPKPASEPPTSGEGKRPPHEPADFDLAVVAASIETAALALRQIANGCTQTIAIADTLDRLCVDVENAAHEEEPARAARAAAVTASLRAGDRANDEEARKWILEEKLRQKPSTCRVDAIDYVVNAVKHLDTVVAAFVYEDGRSDGVAYDANARVDTRTRFVEAAYELRSYLDLIEGAMREAYDCIECGKTIGAVEATS